MCYFIWLKIHVLMFAFLRRIWLDVVINIRLSLYKAPVIFVRFQSNMKTLHTFWKSSISVSLKILPVWVTFWVLTVGKTDSHVERNSQFSEVSKSPNIYHLVIYLKRSQSSTSVCLTRRSSPSQCSNGRSQLLWRSIVHSTFLQKWHVVV